MPDGRATLHTEYWYEHVDPYKYLKDYKIMDQLEMVNGKPVRQVQMPSTCQFPRTAFTPGGAEFIIRRP